MTDKTNETFTIRKATKRPGIVVTGNCAQCRQPITPASSKAQFNRNKGLHMRHAHGVVSPHNQKAKTRRLEPAVNLIPTAPTSRRAYHKRRHAAPAPPAAISEQTMLSQVLARMQPKGMVKAGRVMLRIAELKTKLNAVLAPFN